MLLLIPQDFLRCDLLQYRRFLKEKTQHICCLGYVWSDPIHDDLCLPSTTFLDFRPRGSCICPTSFSIFGLLATFQFCLQPCTGNFVLTLSLSTLSGSTYEHNVESCQDLPWRIYDQLLKPVLQTLYVSVDKLKCLFSPCLTVFASRSAFRFIYCTTITCVNISLC